MQYEDQKIDTIEFDGTALKSARGTIPPGELARRIGISRQALWQIESGRTRPSASTLIRLCAALGLTAEDLSSKKICSECEVTLDK